eukprot:Awhi_evm1s15399
MGKNFQKNCQIGIFDPTWTQKSPLAVIDFNCSPNAAKNVKIPPSIAKKYNSVNVDVVSPDFDNTWSEP